MNEAILRLEAVKSMTGLSKSMIYAMISEDRFPRQIRISSRLSGWALSETNAWIESKITERDSNGSKANR